MRVNDYGRGNEDEQFTVLQGCSTVQSFPSSSEESGYEVEAQ
jgi:hypothetical protein